MNTTAGWATDLADWAVTQSVQADGTNPRRAAMVVATDASITPGRNSAGIAVTSFTGIIWQEHLPRTADITRAELIAILRALQHTIPHRPLVILSDNQSAVEFATGTTMPRRNDLARISHDIRTLASGRIVTFEWVKGHSGHPLNHSADRAARAARTRPHYTSPRCTSSGPNAPKPATKEK